MEALFANVTYWHWFALAAMLLIFEVFGVGGYFLWIGLSAVVVGMLLLVLGELMWQWQLVFFGVLSVVITYFWWRYQRDNPEQVEEPLLNRRGASYVGRTFNLESPVVNGRGKIRADDTHWAVEMEEDLPEGVRVRITGQKDDMTFLAEKVEA